MSKPIFWKNVPMGQEGPKRVKTVPKISFFGFWHKSSQLMGTFLLEYESRNGRLTFFKDRISGKNLVGELWSKILQTNQNAIFFKLEYLTNESRNEVKFCIWLDIRKCNTFSHSFPVSMVRHDPKMIQKTSERNLKNELRYEVDFLHVVIIETSTWFSPFLYMWSGTTGQAKNDSQYWISCMYRMNWAMMQIFCITWQAEVVSSHQKWS